MVVITKELRTCTYNFPMGSDVYQNLSDIVDDLATPASEQRAGIEPGTRVVVVQPGDQETWELVYDGMNEMFVKVA